jgi:hypothetical protein
LGLARIVSGHFTPIEVALTIVIAKACLAGSYVPSGYCSPGTGSKGSPFPWLSQSYGYGALKFTYLAFFPHG